MTSLTTDGLVYDGHPGFRLGPLDLSLESGTRTALVGPSGSGKTTLLRCLAGLERLSAGGLSFGGQVMDHESTFVPPERRRVGFVFQSGALWPHMTALQHLRFAAPRTQKAKHLALLEEMGLGPKAKARPRDMSGGEARRLALARALVGEPKVLLLDEPLHSVDVHLREDLALLIRRVAAERSLTLVLVTHDRGEALALADRLVVLRQGRVVEQGMAEELLQRPRTSFTASFLCSATCLAAEPTGPDGAFRTPFGVRTAEAHGEPPWSLALLPGDVGLADEGAAPEARGVVLYCEPHPPGWMAHVETDGQTLRVPVAAPLPRGATVPLRIVGPIRILPAHEEPR